VKVEAKEVLDFTFHDNIMEELPQTDPSED
jgi:hypothetical protein